MGCCKSEEQEVEERKPKERLHARRNVCCTDIIFLILFLAFWGLLAYIAVFSFLYGDAKRLIYGYDSFGNTCGQSQNSPIANMSLSGRNTSELPNVFFMGIIDPRNAMQICVRHCPSSNIETRKHARDFAVHNVSRLCRYDIDPADYEKQSWTSDGPCPSLPVYKSISLLSRCIPDLSYLISQHLTFVRHFFDIIDVHDLITKFLADISTAWREILALCGIAIVIAFIMVLMMRFLAAIIVWLIVVLSVVGSLVGTGFLWWNFYDEYRQRTEFNQTAEFRIPFTSYDMTNERAFLISSIVASVITVLLLLILIVLRKRISLVVALFREAGKCLTSVPMLLIQPLWTFLILAAFFVYWVIVLLYIATLGTPRINSSRGFEGVEYETCGFARHFWWIHFIGLIWTSELIFACQQFVIAGTVAVWYFTREKKRLSCVICKAVCRLTLHHLGSVCFGSLIITLIKIPRYILMYIEKKCKGSENACAKCCLKCCICGLWCLEKCMKYLNQNAYTIIAIDGKNFCNAGEKAFGVLTSNVLRVIAINSVGAFVLFLGKVGVMAATCSIAVVWLRTISHLNFYVIPVILIGFFSFLVAHCFLSVYEMVVDALLLCFCEDCQINDGSEERRYYMNSSLMDFVDSSNVKIETMKRKKRARRDDGEGGDAGETQRMTAS